jgi:ABC-type lipoprotein release transport system permease subunit
MCIASVLALSLWRSQSGFAAYVLFVAAIIVSFLMAAPYLYSKFAIFIKGLAGRAAWFIRIVSLTIQNQRGFLIGATIISVIVATTILIQTIQYSSEEGSRVYFGRFHYDMELSAGDLTRGRINFTEQLPGVIDVCANDYSGNIDVKGQNISIYRIHGIDTRKAPLFMDYELKSSLPFPFDALESGKNILLTNTLGNIYHVNENDTVILKIYGYDGIYREVPYKVIGFFDDEYTKLGRYALISHNNFSEDFKAKSYSSLLIKTSDIKVASRAIENAWQDTRFSLTTVTQMQSEAKEESRLIISAMGWISYLSAFTGVLGMLFIMMLSIKSRSGELSVYNAMGFDKTGIAAMLLFEMLLAGAAGVMAGCLMGAVISFMALPRLIYSLQIAMSIHFNSAILFRAGLFGIGICTASGITGSISFCHTAVMGGLKSE